MEENISNHNLNNQLDKQVQDKEKQGDSKISLEENKYVKDPNDNGQMDNFIRVGHDYFEIIFKKDRYGIKRPELKARKKPELIFDFSIAEVKSIKKYKDFTVVPDNINYQQEVDNCYNLYYPFPHKPKAGGEWVWTKRILEQVFGEQFDIGLKYMQALYQHPQEILPILSLVSTERSTGKTTFLNYLTVLFGNNMVILQSSFLSRDFNAVYGHANIIAFEETFIDKKEIMEKIKALSTQKSILINPKKTQEYLLPFYAKIVTTSNNESDFMKVDLEEIRFFVRKLEKPEFINYKILKDLKAEIPAFLHHLNQLPMLQWDKSRQLFTSEELKNDSLGMVQFESKSWLFHELRELFIDEFNNKQPNEDTLLLTAKDIKEEWYSNNNRVTFKYLRKVLKEEFGLKAPKKAMRYFGFHTNKNGKPYFIERSYFGDDVSPAGGMQLAK